MWNYNFYVYIVTNPDKSVLYIGVTNDLSRRIFEHKENRGNRKTFAGRYFCYNLIYFEHFIHIDHAISREKEIKKWNRQKKEDLIKSINQEWRFIMGEDIQ